MILVILTTILLIAIFTLTIAKMIKNNFSEYIIILILEFIGIVINFFAITMGFQFSIVLQLIEYTLCIIIPIIVLYLEKKKIFPSEYILYLPWKDNIRKHTILNIIEKHPDSYIAHKKLAEYYEEKKDYRRAENEYGELAEINPNNYDNVCKYAELLYLNKKSDEAINVLRMLLDRAPDCSKASLTLGNILFENEKFKEAILVYKEALNYNPKEYQFYYNLGMTYTRINDFANARDNYKKAAVINSLKDISNLSIGQIYLIFEEYDEAEKYFYKTLESDDEFVFASGYYYLAKIKLIQNNENQAIQYANLALEYNPQLIKKMEQDELFIKILSKLNIKPKKRINTKVNQKELETMEHLGKTFNVVETLTNNYSKSEYNMEREID